MCLAPCFAGCTKEEYDVEVGRVVDALATAGESLNAQLESEREAASEALDFERAAAAHKRLEKVSSEMRGLPEIARPIERLNAVILQCTAEEKTIAAFPILGGLLKEPVFLRFAELASDPRSVESILREALDPQPMVSEQHAARADKSAGAESKAASEDTAAGKTTPERDGTVGLLALAPELPEHLSLIARWFYSKPREGEIFFRGADWPYRRILRSCGRLLAPPAAESGGEAQSASEKPDGTKKNS